MIGQYVAVHEEYLSFTVRLDAVAVTDNVYWLVFSLSVMVFSYNNEFLKYYGRYESLF